MAEAIAVRSGRDGVRAADDHRRRHVRVVPGALLCVAPRQLNLSVNEAEEPGPPRHRGVCHRVGGTRLHPPSCTRI